MAPRAGQKLLKELVRVKDELKPKGITLTIPQGSSHNTVLGLDWFASEQWSEQKVIISLGQLSAGLPIPLYNPEIPFFYELLANIKFSRGIFQLCGDSIRIMVEYSRRAAGLKTLYPQYVKFPPKREEYTVDNFFKHYVVALVANERYRWGVRLVRADGFAEHEKIMRDVDFHNKTNDSARLSKDAHWMEFPLIMEGPYITGRGADGSILTLPNNLSTYKPWIFHWPEKEMSKKKKKDLLKASPSRSKEVEPEDAIINRSTHSSIANQYHCHN